MSRTIPGTVKEYQWRQGGLPFVLYSTVKEQTATSNKTPRNVPGKGIRAQRLKDLLLEKELRSDISTAEFALRLDVPRPQPREAAANATTESVYSSTMMTAGGVIDYEKIAEKLEKSLELIDRRQGRIAAWGAAGSASSVGEESTLRLTKRLNETRAELKSVLIRVRQSMAGSAPSSSSTSGSSKSAANAATAGAEKEGAEDGERNLNPFTVFVREDGTVDWDGAIQSGKELAKFSGEVLTRLQGKSPGQEAPAPKVSSGLAAIDASPGIQQLNRFLLELEGELRAAEGERNKILELHKALRKQGLEVTKAQKGELRIAEDQAVEMRRRVGLQVGNASLMKNVYIHQYSRRASAPLTRFTA